jgi:hypothetical protein
MVAMARIGAARMRKSILCLALGFVGASVYPRLALPATPSASTPRVPTTAPAGAPSFEPLTLSTEGNLPDSVYAPPAPPSPDTGLNEGGVHFGLDLSYLSRYLYRGVIRFRNAGGSGQLNVQIDGKLSYDLGTLPHPYVETFVNVDDGDSISRFQEVRPGAGFDWNLRPFLLSAGYIDYLFPEREKTNDTQEGYARLTFDDSYLLHNDHPLLSPYIYSAFDFGRYHGVYLEGGVSHLVVIEDTGLSFNFFADVAYVVNQSYFRNDSITDNGFQHYDIGMVANYSLNNLFNFSKRYGEFDLRGYLTYSNGIDRLLRADSELWGGAGVAFSY